MKTWPLRVANGIAQQQLVSSRSHASAARQLPSLNNTNTKICDKTAEVGGVIVAPLTGSCLASSLSIRLRISAAGKDSVATSHVTITHC